MNDRRSHFSNINDIMTPWMTKRHTFSIMNDIVNNKKGHSIVNGNFAHKSDGLLVSAVGVIPALGPAMSVAIP